MTGAASGAEDPSRPVIRAWQAHLQRAFGVQRADALATILEARHPNDVAAQLRALVELLDPFVRERLGALSPQSPFATNDLALVVRLQKRRPLPTAARVGALLALVGQVMRSVVRQDARRGRLRREWEDAVTVRPAGCIEILPENGIGAQIVMPLAWPQSEQTSLPEVDDLGAQARDTFDRFVSVAAWAAAPLDPIERLVEAVPDPATRTRMALDDGRLRLRPRSGDAAVEVWLPDLGVAEDVATLLGRELRVRGQRFVRPGGKGFAVADEVVSRDREEDGGEVG